LCLTRSELFSAALKRTFVGAISYRATFGQNSFDLTMGARNYVHADQLADTSSGRRSGIRSRLNRTDVPAYENRDIPGSDIFFTYEFYVSSLNHGISRFYSTYKSFSLDHPQSF
jgi:hypothetical protein